MAKEYRRTCERCGTEWYVTKQQAKERAPNKLKIAGKKMQAAGHALTPFGSTGGETATKAEMMQNRRERVLSRRQCPNCGSTKYRQDNPESHHLTRRALTGAAGLTVAGAKRAAEKVKERREGKGNNGPAAPPMPPD